MTGAPGRLLRLIRDQRIAFVMVGATNTGIGTACYALFLWMLPKGGMNYMVALLGAHIVSVLCAFVLHRRFVFRVRGHVMRDLARFELVNISSLAFNFVMLPVLVEGLGWQPLLSQFAIAGVQVIYSWFAHRDFSFRRAR
ncbi:hypothetical protein BST42_23555 [Mycolicibacterium rhodesiae]|uniref:GtrA/DPMS transmembrane domain-containing protein n=1 Tax=Mycolicibacterium rhodesiae TaxID=36814 RepID=A0A1X0IMA3_MYCRH|nr:hypothetical protein BST42_23555 [Mycolicibacterium rhodesiae]